MQRTGVGLTALLIGLSGATAESAAQDEVDYFRRDRNTSVRDRQKTHTDGLGWRSGGLWLKPQLTLLAGYNDNFAAAETNEEGAAVYQATGRIDLESDWSRHAIYGSIEVPTVYYQSQWTRTDAVAQLGGRLDVDRGLSIDAGAYYAYRTEPLSYAPGGVELRRPLRFDEMGGHVGFAKVFNRVRVAGRAEYGVEDYKDGVLANLTPFDADFRDVAVTTYGLRGDYALTERTSVFASFTANERDHDVDPPEVLLNLDSEGYEALVGVNFDITRLVRGEIGVGYLTQTFDEPTFQDQDGVAARGLIEWYPDELVTVTVGAERSVDNAFAEGASTYVANDASIAVDYEYRRNIILGVSSGYSFDEYTDIDRDDTRWTVAAGVDYELNRNATLNFQVGHEQQTSEGLLPGREFEANVAVFSLTLRR